MSTQLENLLYSMEVSVKESEFVFCAITEFHMGLAEVTPICVFHEDDATSLVISKLYANELGFEYEEAYRMITLKVDAKGLELIGFLAEISKALAENNISVNPITSTNHLNLFVKSDQVDKTVEILESL